VKNNLPCYLSIVDKHIECITLSSLHDCTGNKWEFTTYSCYYLYFFLKKKSNQRNFPVVSSRGKAKQAACNF
jgi:hypothetical protein